MGEVGHRPQAPKPFRSRGCPVGLVTLISLSRSADHINATKNRPSGLKGPGASSAQDSPVQRGERGWPSGSPPNGQVCAELGRQGPAVDRARRAHVTTHRMRFVAGGHRRQEGLHHHRQRRCWGDQLQQRPQTGRCCGTAHHAPGLPAHPAVEQQPPGVRAAKPASRSRWRSPARRHQLN